MTLRIKKDITFNIEGNLLKGVVTDKLKEFNLFYFEPNASMLTSLMSETWSTLKIEMMIDDLEKIKIFLESQKIASKLAEDGKEGDLIIES